MLATSKEILLNVDVTTTVVRFYTQPYNHRRAMVLLNSHKSSNQKVSKYLDSQLDFEAIHAAKKITHKAIYHNLVSEMGVPKETL